MAFDALDSLLRDQQYAIAKRSNFDLPFGGTTEAEFDFLAKNGAVNTMAPNFLSFMAGISASNLATQANRQQQFEQFGKLRDSNSVIANRDSATRNNLLEGDKAEQLMPYVAPQAQATLTNTLTGIDATRENTHGQYLQNQFYPETIRSQNAYREAMTGSQQALQELNKKKADAYAQIQQLDIDYRNQRISKAQYDAEVAKKKADAFDAIREEERLYNNAKTEAANARANQVGANRGNNYYVPPTVINSAPVQQQSIAQQQIPPRSGLGTPQQAREYYVPALPNQQNPAQRQQPLPSNANSVLESAITKQASGQPLTAEEAAVLGVIGLLGQGAR